MKILTRLLLTLFMVVSIPAMGFADSPVTSTPIYSVYLDQAIVHKAQETSALTEEIADYLKDPNSPLDQKVAVINALYYQQTWDTRNNAGLYAKLAYNQPLGELKLENLRADELLNLGYLVLLDNYLNPEKALPYLDAAKAKEPQSFTISIILALAKAQQGLLGSAPEQTPWVTVEQVFQDDTLAKDMRPEAVEIIKGYMGLYQDGSTIPEQQPEEAQSKALLFDFGSPAAVQVFINGSPVYFDVPPMVDSSTNRTMVPFRKIFESLGAQVWFDQSTNSVWGKKGNVSVQLPINKAKGFINGQEVRLDASTKIVDKRTLVPLRFVSQALGYEVTALGTSSNLKVFINTRY